MTFISVQITHVNQINFCFSKILHFLPIPISTFKSTFPFFLRLLQFPSLLMKWSFAVFFIQNCAACRCCHGFGWLMRTPTLQPGVPPGLSEHMGTECEAPDEGSNCQRNRETSWKHVSMSLCGSV